MQVIVTIEGKEAIPVRALPLLTDWQVLSPDVCARIFSGDDTLQCFEGMSAHRLNSDGSYQVVEQREWVNWVARDLRACSERIRAAQASHEAGYQQWRQESLALLPAGVFVWRKELEVAHKLEYGPNSMRARSNRDTFNPTACELNYEPQHGPGQNWRSLVTEGFERCMPVATEAPAPLPPENVQPPHVPLPLTTGDIAFCFDGIRWNEQQWRKPLGDKPKWLKSCIAIPGVRGVSETRWNPVLIAAALVSNGHTNARSVRAKFQKNPLLLPWLDTWKTYEADYLDSD